MKRVGILGGTFDPPHQGHLIMADHVCEALDLDEVWFIPSHLPPHKKDATVPAHERMKMVTEAVKGNDQFHSCDLELKRQGTSYTVDTMKDLKIRYPDHRFYFIIGGDMVNNLSEWYKIEELRSLVTFAGVQRQGFEGQKAEGVVMIELPRIDISSSLIRDRLRKNLTVRYLLPDTVHNYIKENGLYATKP
ncbi:nicotinate-nucleotide adenylyltransferase [Halobacillus shinanisalinarum]|uniref:Probable nicotinate-nucleotide adenylyltransferase n=1 Tax=Halobacillus shinanisalinarum TaxID=2932258 RepID=A0ABY4H0D6_9BACI|nr:nicotinate-nucleotide adenylyltransferase [Halobacillus shinanisalinarum]UOQ93804.1 nicotinate-nucleotide adenylyltransferase [Halobacillus shinanisalinarum]